MSRPVYSIRFPMAKERTGYRRGPRFRVVPDKTGLFGARKIAATMIGSALIRRDRANRETDARLVRYQRASMRMMALWARVWAGQMDQHDARIGAAQAEASAAMANYCQPAVAA